MNQITKLLTILLFVLLSSVLMKAQEAPEFSHKIAGTIQAWTSIGQIHGVDTNSLGWGIRRARLRSNSTFGDKMKGFIQIELTSPKLLDARIEYLVSKGFNIRAGRFVVAGVRAGGMTSHSVIDITERSISAIMWGNNTVGSDYRDYGMDFVGMYSDFKANITLHNGNGSLNILNRQTKVGLQNGSFAISGMLAFKPKSLKGFETGGYYGIGNSEINEYNAFNAYVYYEPKPLRIKAEIIGFTNIGAATNGDDLSRMGYYVFAGYGFAKNWEALARFETYDHNTDIKDNEITIITLGATYSIFEKKWTAAKITAAYIINSEKDTKLFPEVDNNVFQLVMQLVF